MPSHTVLEVLASPKSHQFSPPSKKIEDGAGVNFFLQSLAYRDMMTFILQLNHSMIPRKIEKEDGSKQVQTWELGSETVHLSEPIVSLTHLIEQLGDWITEVPPDTGPQRFGNISFRRWVSLAADRLPGILSKISVDDAAVVEILPYLLGSFGSPERLDYGTGHELSFVAFLACLWKIGYFEKEEAGVERAIVIGIFEPYLNLVRRLIKTYNLEPAGSHGVWGLDDNSFLPYLFGSAQLCPAIEHDDPTPVEGSLAEDPAPDTVTNRSIVARERTKNMYFSAIGFIYDVKRGPFGEHSPMLYDISGIRAGWGKINKGMVKMYNAEVLSKFPVVQHFPFGSLFRWERDPNATAPPVSAHAESQPAHPATLRDPLSQGSGITTSRPPSKLPTGMAGGVTRAPWASTTRPPPPADSSRPR